MSHVGLLFLRCCSRPRLPDDPAQSKRGIVSHFSAGKYVGIFPSSRGPRHISACLRRHSAKPLDSEAFRDSVPGGFAARPRVPLPNPRGAARSRTRVPMAKPRLRAHRARGHGDELRANRNAPYTRARRPGGISRSGPSSASAGRPPPRDWTRDASTQISSAGGLAGRLPAFGQSALARRGRPTRALIAAECLRYANPGRLRYQRLASGQLPASFATTGAKASSAVSGTVT